MSIMKVSHRVSPNDGALASIQDGGEEEEEGICAAEHTGIQEIITARGHLPVYQGRDGCQECVGGGGGVGWQVLRRGLSSKNMRTLASTSPFFWGIGMSTQPRGRSTAHPASSPMSPSIFPLISWHPGGYGGDLHPPYTVRPLNVVDRTPLCPRPIRGAMVDIVPGCGLEGGGKTPRGRCPKPKPPHMGFIESHGSLH